MRYAQDSLFEKVWAEGWRIALLSMTLGAAALGMVRADPVADSELLLSRLRRELPAHDERLGAGPGCVAGEDQAEEQIDFAERRRPGADHAGCGAVRALSPRG